MKRHGIILVLGMIGAIIGYQFEGWTQSNAHDRDRILTVAQATRAACDESVEIQTDGGFLKEIHWAQSPSDNTGTLSVTIERGNYPSVEITVFSAATIGATEDIYPNVSDGVYLEKSDIVHVEYPNHETTWVLQVVTTGF